MRSEVGDLVLCTDGSVMVRPPERCGHGHPLQGRCLVGTVVCGCGERRHLTWTCNRCNDTVFGPSLGPDCALMNGPAAVR
jgi:hypothetical protein